MGYSKFLFVRKELEEVQAQYPDRFQVWYTVDRPNGGKKNSKGEVIF